MIYLSGDLKEKIEALLFATQGLTLEDISKKVGAPEKSVLKNLKILQSDYGERSTAFLIEESAGVWKLTVRSQHVPLVKDLIPSEFPKSLLETLAVIAWKNPVIQSEVIKVRGNKAYDHVSALVEKGLVTSSPRGRSKELKLTDKFYDYFDSTPDEVKKVLNPGKG